jgi:hypothetical protein
MHNKNLLGEKEKIENSLAFVKQNQEELESEKQVLEKKYISTV